MILDKWTPIEPYGTAKLWISDQKFIMYHRKYLRLGATGYMMDGSGYVAKCEVIELVNLV
ncbi:hypothetical protein ACFP1I_13235 [Dyadobacter subterraneus]|uniref:hypothetical protein n=1 Tax=Dyadobacter subterraneus TaxID=2773304 RepID=UPI001D15FE03|nr:hypothetical protein [Dyadobacter subterraneus]